MNHYGFFEGCLKATKQKFDELVNTPRARGTQYDVEKLEIINQILSSVDYNELNKEQADYLIKEFHKIQFNTLAIARRELKRSIKKR